MFKNSVYKIGFWVMLILIGIAATYSVTSSAINYSTPELQAYGMDTVAGSQTILTTSKTYSNTQIVFEVNKPDGTSVAVNAVSDAAGIAKATLTGESTKKAGIYSVSAKFGDNVSNGKFNTFLVQPGLISKAMSKVEPANQVISMGDDKAFVTVTLIDESGNPISGHTVKLISSLVNDQVSSVSGDISDNNGQVVFTVSSATGGPATYTAYDVTSDTILTGKAKVAFFDAADYSLTSNVPNAYQYAASAGNGSGSGSGSIDHLSFEGVPVSINPGENISFKVTAYDSNNQPVVNYATKVHFSVESGNAAYVTMPADYTFMPQDLGSHTFSVALAFQQAGSYQLRVQDTINQAVFGQFIFVVGGPVQQTGGTVSITSPVTGTYSNNVQVVTGKATPGAKLKVFDGAVELANLIADLNGNFTYTTSILADGLHKFTVAEVNDAGTILSTSSSADVTITTNGPKLGNVYLDPSSSVVSGSAVTVKVVPVSKLSKVTLTLAQNTYDLSSDPQGFWFTQIPAPQEVGNYPLNFVIVDQVGNQSKFDNQGTLTVTTLADVPAVVPDVINVAATVDDKKVSLTWDAVNGSTNPIKNYRVYVGTSPTDLTTAIDTFTTATSWYVPNLENGTEYNFAVAAVDEKGNVSEHFSNIVVATPIAKEVTSPEDVNVTAGVSGGEDLNNMNGESSKTGPEVLWLILASPVLGALISRKKK